MNINRLLLLTILGFGMGVFFGARVSTGADGVVDELDSVEKVSLATLFQQNPLNAQELLAYSQITKNASPRTGRFFLGKL